MRQFGDVKNGIVTETDVATVNNFKSFGFG